MLVKPQPLKQGGRIGVCSPAWFVAPEKLARAKVYWENLGYEVVLHPQVEQQDASLAGAPKKRAAALHDLFSDAAVDAVMFSDGGYGSIQVLEHLDFSLIRKNPKIVIGYSDVTLLLLAIHAQTGLVVFHGPTFCDMQTDFDHPYTMQTLQAVLAGETPVHRFTETGLPPQIIQEGVAQGPLLGGNHVRMQDIVGTPYMPTMENALFFTESNRPTYSRLDGDMYHLRLSGALKAPQALLLGSMELVNTDNPKPKYQHLQYNLGLDMMMPGHFPGIPIIADLPFSHVRPEFLTLPLGISFQLEASHSSGVVLTQLESATES
jgi:muramoyltetrapeptide carboxypeptidase